MSAVDTCLTKMLFLASFARAVPAAQELTSAAQQRSDTDAGKKPFGSFQLQPTIKVLYAWCRRSQARTKRSWQRRRRRATMAPWATSRRRSSSLRWAPQCRCRPAKGHGLLTLDNARFPACVFGQIYRMLGSGGRQGWNPSLAG